MVSSSFPIPFLPLTQPGAWGEPSRCFILAWLWLPARPPTPMTPSFPHQLSQRSTEAPFLQAKYSYPVAEHSSGVGVSWEVERVREAQEILFSTKLLSGQRTKPLRLSWGFLVMSEETFFYSFKLCSTNKICLSNVVSCFKRLLF